MPYHAIYHVTGILTLHPQTFTMSPPGANRHVPMLPMIAVSGAVGERLRVVCGVGNRTGGVDAFGGSHAPIPVRLTCTVGLHVRCHDCWNCPSLSVSAWHPDTCLWLPPALCRTTHYTPTGYIRVWPDMPVPRGT